MGDGKCEGFAIAIAIGIAIGIAIDPGFKTLEKRWLKALGWTRFGMVFR